jgi:hypothetical protein
MYVDSSSITTHDKTYQRHLLRRSFREDGKVKHETLANLSACSADEIEAIRLALRHKGDLHAMIQQRPALELRQGLSVGAVWVAFDLARQLGIERALGDTRQGRLALWQVMARLIDQGSRLSAVRLARTHAACDVLGLDAFNEDDLYTNLDWLSDNQERIEKDLAGDRPPGGLFLYDVTSSYLEGVHNELAAFGYNRDGKRGKRQIVIGLLCDGAGEPLSIEVFEGNTPDTRTMHAQIVKAAERFGGGAVTFVGDRGMIKGPQIEELAAAGFHYITAITKAQIQTLLRRGVFQLELFEEALAEICADSGERYVLRRNPVRAAEIAASREDKLSALRKLLESANQRLREHPRAKVATALGQLRQRAKKLGIADWVEVAENPATENGRGLSLQVDEAKHQEVARLDGCYALKTDLAGQTAAKEVVHARYKDLALVEWAFRTSKTTQLELRPVHVRLAAHTRGHVLVVMLAYRIARELEQRWATLDLRVQEGLDELAGLCATEIVEAGRARCCQIPKPRASVGALLRAARVRLPEALPCRGVIVSTKKSLVKRKPRA